MAQQRRINPSQAQIEVARPTAAPTARLVTPQAPEEVPLAGLAKSLASFDPVFRRQANDYLSNRRDKMLEQAGADAASMTAEERTKAMKEGTLDHSGDRVFDEAFAAAHALRLASDAGMELTEQARTGQLDLSTQDVSQVMGERIKAFAEGEGKNNPNLLNAYRTGLSRFQAGLQSMQVTQRVEKRNTEIGNAFVGLVNGEVTKSDTEGRSPEDVAKGILASVPAFAQNLGVKNSDLDTILFRSVIPALADQGRKDLVRAILTDDRGGVGALGNKAAFMAKAQDLIDHADKKWVERARKDPKVVEQMTRLSIAAAQGGLNPAELAAFNEQYPGVMSEARQIGLQTQSVTSAEARATRAQNRAIAEAERARRLADQRAAIVAEQQGTVMGATATLTGRTDTMRDIVRIDSNGAKHTITVDQQLRAGLQPAIDLALKDRAEELRVKPEELSEDQKREVTIGVLSRSGQTLPAWENTYGTLASRLLTPEVAEGKVPQELEGQFGEYQKLFALNPDLARRHAGSDNANTFRAIRELQQNGYSFSEAARRVVSGRLRTQGDGALMRIQEQQLNVALGKLAPGWLERTFGGADREGVVYNASSVMDTVVNMARTHIQAGEQNMEKALQRAQAEVKPYFANVRGTMLNRNEAGLTTPEREEALRAYLDAYGEAAGLKGERIHVLPAVPGTNKLVIGVKDEDGAVRPVPYSRPEVATKTREGALPYTFNIDTVMSWYRTQDDKKRQEVIQRNEQVRATPPVPDDPRFYSGSAMP
jgi:hypothetical protein